MKPRKLFIFASLLFPLLLSGCQSVGKKTNYFKEYTFSGRATSKQIEDIQKGLEDSVAKLSSITRKTETYNKSALSEANQSSESKVKILDDSSNKDLLILETSSTSDSYSKNRGVTLKESVKTESKEWDNGAGYRIVTTKTTSNKNTEESANAYQQTENSKTYKASRIKSVASIPTSSSGTFYINEDGSYTCITSDVSRSVSAVEWGSSTKEYITASKNQRVYSFDKEYRITGYYYYEETSTNRDRSTGEWYSSEQLVSYSYSSVKYEYGNRSTASVKEMTKTAASKNTLVLSASAKAYENTASFQNDAYVINTANPTERNISVSSQSVSDGKQRFSFSTSFSSYSGSVRAQRYELIVNAFSDTGGTVSKTYPITFADGVVSASNSTIYALVNTTNPDATYIVNTSTYYSLYVTITVTFANNRVIVDSCVISY